MPAALEKSEKIVRDSRRYVALCLTSRQCQRVSGMNEQSIFIAALEREPAARPRFLDEACENNPGLRQRVERLIASHEAAVSFMDEPAGHLVQTIDQAPLETSGTQVGPYKLLQQIGEGGMGVVYMAEQHRAGQAPRGPQDHQAGHGLAAGDRPLRGRAAGAGADGPPEHRQGAGCRHDRSRAGRTS